MSEPRASAVAIARAISNVAIRYENREYIAHQVAPVVQVDKEEGKYFTYDRGSMFRDDAIDNRAPGSRAPRSGWAMSNDSYIVNERAHAVDIPRRVNDNADEPLRPFETAASVAMGRVLLRNERAAAAAFFTTSIWGADVTPSSLWDDYAASDPAQDISDQVEAIRQKIGLRPNRLIIGAEVMASLKLHPDGLDRFKHTRTGVMSNEMVAEWLGISDVIVGEAIYTSSAEGATDTTADVWGKHGLLEYVPATADINEPSACYTFLKRINSRQSASLFGAGAQSRSWYEEAEDQDVVEASILTDHKVTSAVSGIFFNGVIS
jgi:hypothetical protein